MPLEGSTSQTQQGEWTLCMKLGCKHLEQPWRFCHRTMPAGERLGWPRAFRKSWVHSFMQHVDVCGLGRWGGHSQGHSGERRARACLAPGLRGPWPPGVAGAGDPGPREACGSPGTSRGSLHGAGQLLPAPCRAEGPVRASELGCRAGGPVSPPCPLRVSL